MIGRPDYRSNATWMLVQAVLQRVIGAASTIALARVLTPAGLGAYSINASTANSAYGVVRLGIDAGTHVLAASQEDQDPKSLEDTLGAALTAFLLIGALGSLGCLALADVVATNLFRNADARPFVQIAALLLFGQVLAQCAYITFAGLHQFTAYVRVMLFGAPGMAAATIVGGVQFGALGAAAAAALAQLALGGCLLYASARTARAIGVRLRPVVSLTKTRDILRIGFPFYLAGLFSIPADYVAQAVMAQGHGFDALGDLRVVIAITTIVSFLPNAIGGPMISAFSRAHQDAQGIDAVFWRSLRVVWTVAFGASLVLGLAWPLLVTVFGVEYRQASTVGSVSLCFAVSACIRNVISNRLLSSGRQRWLLATSAVDAFAFVTAAVLLIPRFGLGGYLVAQTAGAALPSIAVFGIAALRGKMVGSVSRTAGAVLLTLTALLVVVWMNVTGADIAFRTTAALIGGAATVATWVAMMTDRPERQAIAAMIRGSFRRR